MTETSLCYQQIRSNDLPQSTIDGYSQPGINLTATNKTTAYNVGGEHAGGGRYWTAGHLGCLASHCSGPVIPTKQLLSIKQSKVETGGIEIQLKQGVRTDSIPVCQSSKQQ